MKTKQSIYVAIERNEIKSYFNGWTKSLENFEKFDRNSMHRRKRAA